VRLDCRQPPHLCSSTCRVCTQQQHEGQQQNEGHEITRLTVERPLQAPTRLHCLCCKTTTNCGGPQVVLQVERVLARQAVLTA